MAMLRARAGWCGRVRVRAVGYVAEHAVSSPKRIPHEAAQHHPLGMVWVLLHREAGLRPLPSRATALASRAMATQELSLRHLADAGSWYFAGGAVRPWSSRDDLAEISRRAGAGIRPITCKNSYVAESTRSSEA